ncbi:MAG TPA: class I SAM-dependent methyltransferase [Candidatus Binatia bacterium]|jgi:predicted O-methyltransferase YrrM
MVKELDDVYHLPGMLTAAEVDCLFQLGQFDQCQGVIVEIGSWKGKSTVALARGSAKGTHEKIYAIDPHSILPEERYFDDTKSEFLANVERAGVKARVIPMIMTSEEAAKDWTRPIRLLWIDGDHRYEPAKLDFTLWEPFLVEGGILAMHDTIRKQGPKRVLWENVFRSSRFQEIAIVDNITAVRKVKRASLLARLRKYVTLALRAVYIASRKSSVPHSKTVGRNLLRRCTRQAWLPVFLFVFSANIAR